MRTQDNTRVKMDNMVENGDEEVAADEAVDEFASYFKSDVPPKIMITTSKGRQKGGKVVFFNIILFTDSK
jgi:hypothetical protein